MDHPAEQSVRLPLHRVEGHAGPWLPWFAWHPVETEGAFISRMPRRFAWLRIVERRQFYAAPWFCIWAWWEYREVRPKYDNAFKEP